MISNRWSKNKPTEPGIYQVRGYDLSARGPKPMATVVVARRGRSVLVCNLHESTSNDDLADWRLVGNVSSAFEWRGPFVLAEG